MRDYLDNYIRTLSTSSKENVASVLANARVGKNELTALLSRINDSVQGLTPLRLNSSDPFTLVDSNLPEQNFRLIMLKIREMFGISNNISTLIESHTELLSSEIAAIEADIAGMEKFITNFSQTISDNEAYNYVFLEPFSNNNGLDTEVEQVDRSSRNFSENERATVRSEEGVLAISPSSLKNLGLVANIIQGNATSFTSSETGLQEMVKSNKKSWRQTIVTSSPVSAPIEGGIGSGVQMVLEFSLTGSSPASSIRFAPTADSTLEIQKIYVYPSDDENSFFELIEEPVKLDAIKSVNFPTQLVKKFRVLISQPTYDRRPIEEEGIENIYKKSIYQLNDSIRKEARRTFSHKISNIQGLASTGGRTSSKPITSLSSDRGPMASKQLVNSIRDNSWKKPENQSVVSRYFKTGKGFRNLDFKLADDSRLHRIAFSGADGAIPSVFSSSFSERKLGAEYKYHYEFGIENVSIGIEQPSFRAVYISKKLEPEGEIGELQLRVGEQQTTIDRTNRDLTVITSTEYSVTNVSNPQKESDWIPILPAGQANVDSERLFPDKNGEVKLRFAANGANGINVYNYGFLLSKDNYIVKYDSNQNITGLTITKEESANSLYTAIYTPISGNDSVSFENRGFNNDPILSSASSNGAAGEHFVGTGGRNTIQLSHIPYVNLNFSTSPIRVKLEDGNFAVNITDYKNKTKPNLPADGLFFIHSGKNLIFNKPINSPFRVYYQYSENDVRYRIVLRCNDTRFATPKVDYVHIKAKTRDTVPIVEGS